MRQARTLHEQRTLQRFCPLEGNVVGCQRSGPGVFVRPLGAPFPFMPRNALGGGSGNRNVLECVHVCGCPGAE
jgi:hypothetical protein